jgi:hypothetical protein
MIGKRDMTPQEIHQLLLSMDNYRTNLTMVTANLSGKRRVRQLAASNADSPATFENLLDIFAKRHLLENQHQGISNLNVFQFCKQFNIFKGSYATPCFITCSAVP